MRINLTDKKIEILMNSSIHGRLKWFLLSLERINATGDFKMPEIAMMMGISVRTCHRLLKEADELELTQPYFEGQPASSRYLNWGNIKRS